MFNWNQAIQGLFANQQQQQPQSPQQQQQVQQPAPAHAPQPPAAPDFSKLWQAPEQQSPSLRSPLTVNPQEVMKIAQSKKFVPNGIPPAVLQAMQAGDFSQFGTWLNQTMQFVYHTAMTDAMQATGGAFDNYGQQIEAVLPNVMKDFQINNELASQYDVFSKPEYAPMVKAMTAQMQAQYPTDTPAQIKQKVGTYLEGFAQSAGFQKVDPQAAQQQQQQVQQQQQAETDWGAWGGFEAPSPTPATTVAGSQPAASAQPTGF